MTINDLFWKWLDGHEERRIKTQTRLRYVSLFMNHVNGNIGSKDACTFTKREALAFMNDLQMKTSTRTHRVLSSASMNMVLTLLKLLFRHAQDFDLVPMNPFSCLRSLPRGSATRVNAFSRDEQRSIESFVKERKNPEDEGMILCLYTGIRLGELLALLWEDIDLTNGLLFVNKTVTCVKNEQDRWITALSSPKTVSSCRVIPLPEFLRVRLVRLKGMSHSDHVVSHQDGRPMTGRLYRWRYQRMLQCLSLSRLHFHALRHTFATRALESGMDIRTLADVLGHANPSITLSVYAHSLPDHKRRMMDALHPLVD